MTDLRVYTGSADDDVWIAHWWMRMVADGDLARIWTANSRTLSALFRMVTPPRTLVYAIDTDGVWFAMWGEQMLNSAFVGAWLRRDVRKSRRGLHAILDAETWHLTVVPTLFVTTPHANLLAGLRRLGYAVLDRVEGWLDGQDAWVAKLTRSAHDAALRKYGRRSVELARAMDATVEVG